MAAINKPDNTVSLLPVFKVTDRENFNKTLAAFAEKTKGEKGMVNYGFMTCGDLTLCRESYVDGDALAFHLANVDAALKESLKYATIQRLEAMGPKAELDKVRAALTPLGCKFFESEPGAILGVGHSH